MKAKLFAELQQAVREVAAYRRDARKNLNEIDIKKAIEIARRLRFDPAPASSVIREEMPNDHD